MLLFIKEELQLLQRQLEEREAELSRLREESSPRVEAGSRAEGADRGEGLQLSEGRTCGSAQTPRLLGTIPPGL